MKTGHILGFAIGFLLAGILIAFKRKKNTREYDEMQMQKRGVAYKITMYAGFTLTLFNVVAYANGLKIFMSPGGLILFMYVQIFIFISVCIFNNAYIGLQQNYKMTCILFLVYPVLLVFSQWDTLTERKSIIEDGVISTSYVNIFLAILMLVANLELFIKSRVDKTAKDDE